MSEPEKLLEEQSQLWQQLTRFEITRPTQAWTFEARLARENGWGLDRALAVVREYKRFLFLLLTLKHPLTPSEDIDTAWHLHLLYTKSYWDEFCATIARRPIHHLPSTGSPEDWEKFHRQYEQTLASYTAVFGEPPPRDIWPSTAKRFETAGQARWVNLNEVYIIPRPLGWLKRLLFRET